MRIALFHNLGAGGAKRHLYEQARALHARGHRLDLFVPEEADESFRPLGEFCEEVRVFGSLSPLPPSLPVASSLQGRGSLKSIASSSGERTGELQAPPSLEGGTTGREGAPRGYPGVRELLHAPLLLPLAETLWVLRQTRRLAASSRVQAQIAQAVDAGGYDVFYVHHDRQRLAPDLLRDARSTPTVFCCHDTPRPMVEWPAEPEPGYDAASETFLRRKRLGRFLVPALVDFQAREVGRFETNARAAGCVLANSFYSRECLARVAGVDARVCYPGVDAEFFHPNLNVTRERSVVSVGSLLPVKRHDFVIRSVARIPAATRPRVEVIGHESRLPGDTGVGPETARLTRLAEELGVDLTIRRDDVMRETYQRAGVVAFAPFLEPFGLVALEAAACGTPVVGVREGGVRETVVDGETGFLTDRDPDAFAAALARILDDSALASGLGEQARARAVADWSWDRSTDLLETYLIVAAAARRAKG